MEAPDIVYVVRSGERNDSLRYSLRSLENLPHRRVFVAGFCPSWVKNVTRVPIKRNTNKFDSIEANLRGALAHPEIGQNAIYFNDDFFVMQPIDSVPKMHGGPASEYHQHGELIWRMRKTIKSLPEVLVENPVTYDGLHVPMPLAVNVARRTLETMPRGCLWRTWYGNLIGIGGTLAKDVKSREGAIVPGPFMSSSPRSLNILKHHLEDVLPQRSQYV